RDLGGYETQDGYYTKAHHYIRASSPANATPQDIDLLYDYGVRVTIDLRSDFEKEVQPSPFETDDRFENYEVNLMDQAIVKVVPQEIREYRDLGGVYIFMLEAHKGCIKKVFDIFLAHPYECVLFHCSAGKDRTGVIAGLLLELAGCHDYDIIKNYSESYQYNLSIIEDLSEIMDPDSEPYLRSSPRFMMILLDFLREHYGSTKGYLLDLGFTEQEIEDLKEMFVI
ncbi:MAG: tyrosine-protein phosphatase, partial [bacterium]